jgi:chromosome segregation ATPase
MNPHFQQALQALQRASEHLIVASNAMHDSHAALTEAIREVLNANSEHNDLRETVERLQTTVLAQTADIQALRVEVAALKNGRH